MHSPFGNVQWQHLFGYVSLHLPYFTDIQLKKDLVPVFAKMLLKLFYVVNEVLFQPSKCKASVLDVFFHCLALSYPLDIPRSCDFRAIGHIQREKLSFAVHPFHSWGTCLYFHGLRSLQLHSFQFYLFYGFCFLASELKYLHIQLSDFWVDFVDTKRVVFWMLVFELLLERLGLTFKCLYLGSYSSLIRDMFFSISCLLHSSCWSPSLCVLVLLIRSLSLGAGMHSLSDNCQ